MRIVIILSAVFSLAVTLIAVFVRQRQVSSEIPAGMTNPQLRAEWEHMLLQDPNTGLVPVSRAQELAFATGLPAMPGTVSRTEYYQWKARGPFNFGGRTRGAAMDVADHDVLIAGSASGGIYRSEDQGESWTKVSASQQNFGITCLKQDTRTGKENTWYAGSGEDYNSASGTSGARYIGNGILKSTDGGKNWSWLESTQNATPQSLDPWDRVWRIAIDPLAAGDVVLAAITGSIMRSTDGGESWTKVLGQGNAYYTEVQATTAGVFYATFSSDGVTKGIFRSADGENWVNVTPSGWPSAYNRIVFGIDPSNESDVYFMAETPGTGKKFTNFRGDVEWVSFWKYSYISGDGTGAGGFWENRSVNLPSGPFKFDDLNLQGGYNMLVAVKPDDENTVIIGGTNLFRSASAFEDSTHTTMIGGYDEDTDLPDFQIYENHHPDQHWVFFHPDNPDVMFSANDGGFFRTDDVTATTVSWESLNNGYNTTQFYTVAIDQGTEGSDEIMGGLQDNGTFYNNSEDPYAWKFPWSYDGAFTAIGNGGSLHLTSIQLGRMYKLDIDEQGNRNGFTRFDPEGGANYYFIHPWAMDPNNGTVYLPLESRVWRNDSVATLAFDDSANAIETGWTMFPFVLSGNGSAVGISTANPSNRVYIGTSTGNAYRIDNAHTSSPTFTNVTNFLSGGGFLNCIAVDPQDGNHAVAVFSNYNVHSIYFTEDGGATWFRAGGNLEAPTAPDGAPEDLYNISTAPSIRWAEILNVGEEKVYLLGTSVGLFGTNKLHPGTDRASDSTQWLQLAKEEIGNTVVTMIDSRESDGFVAVATHGAGIFSTHIPFAWGVTGIDEETRPSTSVFPNPAGSSVNINTGIPNREGSLYLFDVKGKQVRSMHYTSCEKGLITLNTSDLDTGLYIAQFPETGETMKFMVLH